MELVKLLEVYADKALLACAACGCFLVVLCGSGFLCCNRFAFSRLDSNFGSLFRRFFRCCGRCGLCRGSLCLNRRSGFSLFGGMSVVDNLVGFNVYRVLNNLENSVRVVCLKRYKEAVVDYVI